MRRRRTHGSSVIEFALISPVLFALLIGALVNGTRLVKALQVVQVARDGASMYSRGVDFSITANKQLVARLGKELGLDQTGGSGGNGVVIFTTLEYVTQAQCDALAATSCNNNKWVITNRISFGDTTLRTSTFGSPTCALDALGNVDPLKAVSDPCAVVSNTGTLANFGTPDVTVDGFKPGQLAYAVELYAQSGWGKVQGSYALAFF
jgi:hypothetical protein